MSKNIFLRSEAAPGKRKLSEISFLDNGNILHGGKEYVNFSSNDYLAFSTEESIKEAMREALYLRAGTTSSRLMTGSAAHHHLLEDKIAEFKNKPAALVFNSGYQANVGVISALVEKGDCVFADRIVHASIVDGIKLSGARCFRFRHNDTEHLEAVLKKNRGSFEKALIVTESVFSMDGDEAPLEEIVRIKNEYNCRLMLDEAHATGIFGPDGSGIACELGLSGQVDIIMGTFSKALGVFGAYVATSHEIKELLVNRCRSFIYSTALPVSIISGCLAAIDLVKAEPRRREGLLSKAFYFRKTVKIDTIPGRSQIVPIIVGDEERTLFLSEVLKDRGWWVTPIRPPTVPPGTSRLRVSITLHHDIETLESFIRDLEDVCG
jgi:8-amino-7-oxononanoate synthase